MKMNYSNHTPKSSRNKLGMISKGGLYYNMERDFLPLSHFDRNPYQPDRAGFGNRVH